MPKEEIGLRQEAVARVLSGEPVAKVAGELGRTDRWVRKWVGRYDPGVPGWAGDGSRVPTPAPPAHRRGSASSSFRSGNG